MSMLKGLAVAAVVATAVLVFAGCDGRADTLPTPEPTATLDIAEVGVVATPTPTPEHYVRLLVVSDGAHDSLLLEWIGGPPNPTKWQYRRGTWRRDPEGEGCWTRGDSGCGWREDDGGRVWRFDFGAWTDIPGSGASTRSFRDAGLPARGEWGYEVRAVVGTVAAEPSGFATGGTQEQGRQFPDISASDVVEGDGQRRWLVLGFTIVIPDGVRIFVYGPTSSPYREPAEQVSLSVHKAGSIVHGAPDDDLGDLRFGPDGEVLHRYVPPEHARRGAAVLDQIIASVRPHTP